MKVNVAAGLEPKAGKLWWACWKSRYMNAADEGDGAGSAQMKEEEVLVVKTDPPPALAWDALCGLLQSKPQRDPLLQFCRTTESLSRDESVILVQATKLLNPSCSNEHLKALLSVFQAFHHWSRDGSGAASFVAAHPEVELVFPIDELVEITGLGAGEKLETVKYALQLLYGCNDLGRTLFSSSIKSIAIADVDKIIADAIEELQKQEKVTEAAFTLSLRVAQGKASAVAGAGTCKGKHMLTTMYRGLSIQLQAASLKDRVYLSLLVACKAAAVECEVLAALPGETELLSGSNGAMQIDPILVCKADAARKHLDAVLETESEESRNGDALKATALVKSHSKDLLGKDAQFDIELAVLTAMLGSGGESLLRSRMNAAVSVAEATTIQAAMEKCENITSSAASKWATKATAAELTVANSMLQRMASGEPVQPSQAGHSTFITGFAKQLETLYMSREPSVASTIEELKSATKDFKVPTTVIDFLTMLETHITSLTKPASFQQLRPFAVWQHLTTKEQHTKIAGWRKAILKEGQAEVSKPKVVKTAPKAVCAKSKTASIDVDAAARALLKMSAKPKA
eukprot:6458786-Amphidinium_carterae.1